MSKALRTFLIILAIGIGLLLLVRFVVPRLDGFGAPTSSVPIDLKDVIPTSWYVVSGMGPPECDFDRDGEDEYLVVYRYDPPATPGPNGNNGLIGAVIFDSQVNRVPQEPSVESPYRPAFLVPYKLLPDMYTDKGQGYLGEASAQVIPVPVPSGESCLGKEIVVTGTAVNNGNADAPNFLSIFRWEGEKVGYTGVHYTGNSHIKIDKTETGAVKGFITSDRLDDRSAFCEVQPYLRYLPEGLDRNTVDPVDTPLDFRPVEKAFTIDFCAGIPLDPYHPEGVVVALLRGGDPGNTTFTGDSFLTPAGKASLPDLLKILEDPARTAAFPVLSVTNPGALGVMPEQGYLCPGLNLEPGSPVWWCAREQVNVITDILVAEQPHRVVWRLISIANDKTVGDVHWRVDNVQME